MVVLQEALTKRNPKSFDYSPYLEEVGRKGRFVRTSKKVRMPGTFYTMIGRSRRQWIFCMAASRRWYMASSV